MANFIKRHKAAECKFWFIFVSPHYSDLYIMCSMTIKYTLAVIAILLSATQLFADSSHSHTSPYAGQESRSIKSLSADDIAELKRGSGWGLAKAAELNGLPGPAHLLELQRDISLTAAQVAAIKALHQDMQTQAIDQGERLIALEAELESHFQNRTITDAILQGFLEQIADARRNLRYIHLSAHLKTPDILSQDQIENYNALRGYGQGDPCANVPKGHIAFLWRRHNGCG